MQSGTFDLGGALHTGISTNEPFGVFGLRVSDGRRVERAVDEIIRLGQSHAGFPNLGAFRIATQSVSGVKFPFDGPQGKPIESFLGFGDEAVFFAFGEDAEARLTQSIERSSQANFASDTPPVRMSFAIGHFLTEAEGQSLWKQASGGRDHVSVTTTQIENGIRYTVNVENGVIKGIYESVAGSRASLTLLQN